MLASPKPTLSSICSSSVPSLGEDITTTKAEKGTRAAAIANVFSYLAERLGPCSSSLRYVASNPSLIPTLGTDTAAARQGLRGSWLR